jgi:hypothetical protein
MATNLYFSGQGRVYVAERDGSGNHKQLVWVGNVNGLSVQFETEEEEHTESYSGQRLVDATLITAKRANFTARLESFDLDNLALGLFGTKVTVTGASVTNEAFPSGLVVGDVVATKHPKISSVTVKDSAGTPATLVLNTDYSIEDDGFGRIKILNLGAYTQPFKADYTYGARKDVGMFKNPPPVRWIRFDGLNTANSDSKIQVDLYKGQFAPLSELALIGNEFAGYDLTGKALLDDTKLSSDPLGQFGRIRDLA